MMESPPRGGGRLGSGPVVTGAWELSAGRGSIPHPAPCPYGKASNEGR
jgi:hypothetical protein